VLSLVVLVLGSVRFARYDWSGIPLDRAPAVTSQRVSDGCLERIEPYLTESGREISPTVVDEQQYLSMIERFRGTPDSELQVECLYEPFTRRVGAPWLASLLPVEEGLALGLVNTGFLLLALWVVLATLRDEGHDPRTLLVAGVLFAVSWNTLMFGTSLLAETGPLAAVALCWFALVRRRPWWTLPVVVIGVLFKEVVLVVLPVIWADAAIHRRDDPSRTTRFLPAYAPAIGSTVCALAALAAGLALGPPAAAAWPGSPSVSVAISNLDPVGLIVLAIGVGPVLVPAILWWWHRRSSVGSLRATADPAVVGLLVGFVVLAWSALTADLSPRHYWPFFPFAVTLAARWFSQGRPRDWLERLPVPAALVH